MLAGILSVSCVSFGSGLLVALISPIKYSFCVSAIGFLLFSADAIIRREDYSIIWQNVARRRDLLIQLWEDYVSSYFLVLVFGRLTAQVHSAPAAEFHCSSLLVCAGLVSASSSSGCSTNAS